MSTALLELSLQRFTPQDLITSNVKQWNPSVTLRQKWEMLSVFSFQTVALLIITGSRGNVLRHLLYVFRIAAADFCSSFVLQETVRTGHHD